MREYRKVSGILKFRRGAEQMRSAAIEAFLNLGRREMNGLTAAQIMRQLKLTE